MIAYALLACRMEFDVASARAYDPATCTGR
jgi:hypothetical protein